ncbi:DNA recombination protein RmuC [Nocardioides rotundus]|uniref:DNA recombination protein RmuC n=1 Tax=Nocardioides rotundus TaxID=1774216 RepID=UPI001CBDD556|nr:DNA recombination protein RmuC [Nocardioides rotundus]
MNTTTLLPLALVLALGLLLGGALGVLWARSRPAATRELVDRAEVLQGLDRLGDQLHELDRARARWQGEFTQQVLGVQHATESLRRETGALSTALRKPQVRGRWGEMTLRRTVELAGLTDRCDFTEQHRLEGGALRPDLVVHLAGGRSIVVDAKVPLDAFLDGVEATDDADRTAALTRHARQLRTHVEQLASKRYWTALPAAPEFVVLFVPGEAILSAALEQDRDLLDHAATRQVVLASPTTLVALLRTVAQGWRHEALAEDAREVHRLGRELHERLGTMAGHLDKVGRSLRASVEAYNAAIGSLESRVLVSARRLGDLGDLPETSSPDRVDAVPRALTLATEADETPARRAHGA